jgi:hypothetical protein
MYLRLFHPYAWMRWCCWLGIGILFCAYGCLVPIIAIHDYPHGDAKWDMTLLMNGASVKKAFEVIGGVSMVFDLYILILPLPILLNLQISTRRRLGLCLIFLTAVMYAFRYNSHETS